MKVETKTVEKEVVRVEKVKERTFILTEEEMAYIGPLMGRVSGARSGHIIDKIYMEWKRCYNTDFWGDSIYDGTGYLKLSDTGDQAVKNFLGK